MREKKVINISVMNRNILLEQSSAHNDKTIKISTHMIIIYIIHRRSSTILLFECTRRKQKNLTY